MSKMAYGTRKLWRAVRDAAQQGITLDALTVALEGVLERPEIVHRLRSLRAKGYLRFDGHRRTGCYSIGRLVPDGESATVGAPGPAGLAEDEVAMVTQRQLLTRNINRKPAPEGVPAGAVNSVFALADALRLEGGRCA